MIEPGALDFSPAAAAAAKSVLLLLLSRFSPTLCDPIDGSPPGLPHPWDSPGKSTGLPFPSPDEKHYSPLLMGLFL